MHRFVFFVVLCILLFGKTSAQDMIVLQSQPAWQKGMPIFNYCSFYEETGDLPLSFTEVQNKPFAFYAVERRNAGQTNRPLLIQWLRFSISNQSATDSVHLWLNIGAHYFARLYDSSGQFAKSGIYETSVAGNGKGAFQISLLPNTSKTFWVRTEDRQGQMIPAWVSLETPYTFAAINIEGARHDRLLFLVLAMLTGCLFFISLFAFYHYLLYKDKAFLWYVAYTITAAFVGLFWIDIRHSFGLFSSFMHDLIFSVFLFLVPVLYTVFIGKMLKLPEHFKKAWMAVKVLLIVALIQMLIEFVTIRTGQFLFTDYYGYFVSLVPVALSNLILLVLTACSKEKVKWFMFGGLLSMLLLWCMPMIIFPAIDFRTDAITMLLIFIPFYFLLGLTIEAICFSFALSYRSKLVLVEKNDLQRQYGLQLQEELTKRTEELQEKSKLVEQQKIEQVQLAFEQRIAETEMTALRAQMNPHFIFNCLNSIKLYTLENDAASASQYLTIFSQLIRSVLENSRSEKVSFQKELEALQLYIELEAMRFKDKVQYYISVAPDIDQQYIEIPPLLIQPYVENAIWHGLMHKKNGGIIHVDVTLPAEQHLQIEITDNGVGRQLAAEYKSKTATRQKSFGLKMTSERISIINQLYKMNAEIQIIDLKDENQQATGTKVIIGIPI